MANIEDVWQPGFLDPLLEFLSANLPPPLYSLLVRVLSHSLAALTAISKLCISLISSNPSDWNAQALLPPIITIFAAYLALASIYRTTTWLARVMFWFLKWGTVLGIIMSGAGYFMGTAGNAVGNQGVLPMLAGYLAGLFDDNGRGQSKPQRKTHNTRQRSKRPKAWESFDRHQEWQYRQQNEAQDQNPEIQKLMDVVAGTAGQIFGGNWWNMAKSVVKDSEVPGSDAGKKSPKSEGQQAGRSRSR